MNTVHKQASAGHMRRRTFLIDRRFQLKYTFIIVLVGVVVSAVLGYFVYKLSAVTTDMATMDARVPMAEEKSGDEVSFLKKTREEIRENFDSQVLFSLVGFVVVMAVFLFIWGIFITHRVAGPIFLISGYLKQLGQGQVPKTRPLRKGDQLKDFFDTFSAALAQLKKSHLEEALVLDRCVTEIQNQGVQSLDKVVQALRDLAARKKSWKEVT